MDRKSVLVLVICGILFMAWTVLYPRLYPPLPVSRTNTMAAATNTLPAPESLPRADGLTNLATAITTPNAPEELLIVSNETARYTFTSHGGGLKMVELLKYPESVACGSRRAVPSQRLASLNGPASQPILALLQAGALQGDGVFKLSKFSRTEPLPPPATNQTRLVEGIRAEKAIGTSHYLSKEFEISSNYLVNFRFRLENHSGQQLAVPAQNWVVGSATPMNPHDDETDVGLHWHDGKDETSITRAWFDNKNFMCLPGVPKTNYSAAPGKITWAIANNQFFFIALMPKEPAHEIAATRYPWPPPDREEVAEDPTARTNQFGVLVTLQHPATSLAPGQALDRHFTLFAGPREYRLLQRIGAQFHNEIDSVMGFSSGFGGSFFGIFSGILLLSMNALHSLGLSYALAIIAITVIIKVLFWPLTQASTRSMKRMQALQPQIKVLQEKYKDDPKKQQEKMMEFWREHKVNPVGGCLPMLLQIPVFIGFFNMVRTAIELRGATFLWACDLTRPDTVWVIPGLNFPLNPLPLLMGATMFWQASLTPMSPSMDPAQQKIMKYFPMIFLVILYNYSAGLTLYWTVQNLLTIAQTMLTRTKEEGGKPAGPGTAGAKPPAKPPAAPPAPARPQPKKKK